MTGHTWLYVALSALFISQVVYGASYMNEEDYENVYDEDSDYSDDADDADEAGYYNPMSRRMAPPYDYYSDDDEFSELDESSSNDEPVWAMPPEGSHKTDKLINDLYDYFYDEVLDEGMKRQHKRQSENYEEAEEDSSESEEDEEDERLSMRSRERYSNRNRDYDTDEDYDDEGVEGDEYDDDDDDDDDDDNDEGYDTDEDVASSDENETYSDDDESEPEVEDDDNAKTKKKEKTKQSKKKSKKSKTKKNEDSFLDAMDTETLKAFSQFLDSVVAVHMRNQSNTIGEESKIDIEQIIQDNFNQTLKRYPIYEQTLNKTNNAYKSSNKNLKQEEDNAGILHTIVGRTNGEKPNVNRVPRSSMFEYMDGDLSLNNIDSDQQFRHIRSEERDREAEKGDTPEQKHEQDCKFHKLLHDFEKTYRELNCKDDNECERNAAYPGDIDNYRYEYNFENMKNLENYYRKHCISEPPVVLIRISDLKDGPCKPFKVKDFYYDFDKSNSPGKSKRDVQGLTSSGNKTFSEVDHENVKKVTHSPPLGNSGNNAGPNED